MSKTKTEMFRAKGADILKDRVSGISDFLGDSLSRRENPQCHKCTRDRIRRSLTKLLAGSIFRSDGT